MPRKRATKAQSKRAKLKLKDSDGEDGLSAAQREGKLKGYLEDCDATVENIKQKYDAEQKFLECLIDKMFVQIRLQQSQEERLMELEQYILSQENMKEEEMDTFDTDRQTILCNIPTTNNKSTISDTLSKYRSRTRIQPILEEGSTTSTVKKKTRESRKKAQEVSFAPKPTPMSASSSSFITPAMTRNAAALGWNTPLVTPKFDPRLPITPAQRRDARPGEIAMSMAGSPLNVDKKSLAINRNGKTLQIQVPVPGEYEEILDNFDIPDYLDLENNSQGNIKKMMDMLVMIMKKGEEK